MLKIDRAPYLDGAKLVMNTTEYDMPTIAHDGRETRRFLRKFASAMIAIVMATVMTSAAMAQGILLDRDESDHFRLPRPFHPIQRPVPPERTYRIKELAVDATVTDTIAKVQTSQTFVNTGSATMEVSFVFPLPYDGAIDRLTFMVDGKEYEAKLLDREKARSIYEGYVRRNQDPALLEWVGHGLFKTSVFPVPAGEERTVTLRYSQVLGRTNGLTEMVFPLATARFTDKPVEKLRFRVTIDSGADIRNVYSPSHDVKIKRLNDHQAVVSYETEDETPTTDFQLLYDVGDKAIGMSLLSYRPDDDEDGYFLMLLSPEIPRDDKKAPRKTVVMVVDRSGSMSGKKIEQARESLKFVINNLRDGDLFNVVAYDTEVELFRPELQKIQ